MDISTSIALASACVGLSALGISIWQGYLQRKHNRISVLPCLSFEPHIDFNNHCSIVVKNHGLGPARFKKMIWLINDKEHFIKHYKDLAPVIKSYEIEDESIVNINLLNGDRLYNPGFEDYLIRIPVKGDREKAIMIFNEMKKQTIILKFESLYGDEYIYKRKIIKS